MLKWNGSGTSSIPAEPAAREAKQNRPALMTQEVKPSISTVVYQDSTQDMNYLTLQRNLNQCLSIIENEVMKGYITSLHELPVVKPEAAVLESLPDIHFFRITELVYQEDEFSVYKLATAFHALSNKPCTLVLLLQSDGQTNEFYLGVRSRDKRYSTATMKKMLEQSILGLFPGSKTAEYLNEELKEDLSRLSVGCVSSVTCVADYKQDKDSVKNQDFVQGLEKFVYSMQGKPYTAVCIANNLSHDDLADTRKEYEQIYTQLSPFANMQYNFAQNTSSSTSDTQSSGTIKTEGSSTGVTTTDSTSDTQSRGTNRSRSDTTTEGRNTTEGSGYTQTIGYSDGVSDTVTDTHTEGKFTSVGYSQGYSKGFGISLGPFSSNSSVSYNASVTRGTSSSDSHSVAHGTSHTDTYSDAISRNLSYGINSSRAIGDTVGENEGTSQTISNSKAESISQNTSESINTSYAKALTDTFGNSQAITLNIQNKSLMNTMQRMEKQLARIDECESLGMWDYAAYFLGESAAEAETAASMYQSLVSGTQSGIEMSAVNTWIESSAVRDISAYVTHFMHPLFLYDSADAVSSRKVVVDPTALSSTNELAIQMGLPRYSVKGLPVIEHALFAQEVLSPKRKNNAPECRLGSINHLGKDTAAKVNLDVQSLSMHTFITGSTGTGKSNTVYQLLSELEMKQVKFLVVEPAKGEYKNVFGHRKDVSVYGTNPKMTKLLRINPFSFPESIHIYEHMDRLVEIFNVCWPMYAAMPAVLKDAIERAYVEAGWDLRTSTNRYSSRLFPTFADVLHQIDAVMNESQYSADSKGDYKGALCTRIRSLTNGINGMIFGADELSSEELFDQNVIVDISRVGSTETKSLIMGLLVMKLQEHRMAEGGMNLPLKHVTVLEEAHNLLKRTSTEQSTDSANLVGKSVEMITNAIAEMRTYGEGFIIADQAPGLLDMAVIRNTNTKIILRLPEYSDRELVGKAIGLTDEQIEELARLNKGVAAVYQNDWLEAVLCHVDRYDYTEEPFAQQDDYSADDLQKELLHIIVRKDIHRLETLDARIINSNLSAVLKTHLLDLIRKREGRNNRDWLPIAYEFFHAAEVMEKVKKIRNGAVWEKSVKMQLNPSIAQLSQKEADDILLMLAFEEYRKNPADTNGCAEYLKSRRRVKNVTGL